MNEELLKVALSPSENRFHGTFTEGQPIAELIGSAIAVQVLHADGRRSRYFGLVVGVTDSLANIDNEFPPDKQVERTTIYLADRVPPIELHWSNISVAVAEAAVETQEERKDG